MACFTLYIRFQKSTITQERYLPSRRYPHQIYKFHTIYCIRLSNKRTLYSESCLECQAKCGVKTVCITTAAASLIKGKDAAGDENVNLSMDTEFVHPGKYRWKMTE